MEDLLDYLRMEGSHDLDFLPIASEEDAPSKAEESTDDEGDYGEVKSVPMEVSSKEGEDYGGSTEEGETREKEDPEEDPREGSPVGEEDPDDDSEVSEGQLMGSEDCVEDWEEEREDHTIQDEQARGPEDLEEEIDFLWYRAGCEIGMNRRKRSRCGRMCRGTCPLDVPDQ